jgi:cell shape-determining protein MreC
MKSHYENLFGEQVNNIKKLVKEREILHLYIQRLEMENASLATITNENETVKLLNHSSQSPSTLDVTNSPIKSKILFEIFLF